MKGNILLFSSHQYHEENTYITASFHYEEMFEPIKLV